MKYSKIKIAIYTLLFFSGWYHAYIHPDILIVSGIAHGLVFFGMFCVEDPKPKEQEG